jgi:predicted acetyltransferase
MEVNNMSIRNTNFIEQVRTAIKANINEVKILKKINQKTGISKADAKKLFDKYTDVYWEISRTDADGMNYFKIKSRLANYLVEDDNLEGE